MRLFFTLYSRFVLDAKKPGGCRAFVVEIPRFELGQTEPKSVVLPLHHISLYIPLPSPIVGEVATFAPSKTFFESPGPVAASGEALFAAQRYFFF